MSPAAVGPFAEQARLTFGSFAMYPNTDGTLSFQFAHLLPALLAEAHDLGGDRLMFAATPLIGRESRCSRSSSPAWRLLRNPYVALAALVSFAFLLPEVSFSRDTYSEIPMQVLLFTALWILTDRGAFRPAAGRRWSPACSSGMLQAARIDALVALTGVPRAVRDHLDPRRRARSAVGRDERGRVRGRLDPGLVLGFTDVRLRSQQLHPRPAAAT